MRGELDRWIHQLHPKTGHYSSHLSHLSHLPLELLEPLEPIEPVEPVEPLEPRGHEPLACMSYTAGMLEARRRVMKSTGTLALSHPYT